MPHRGALYLVWGDAADAPLRRSLASLARFHPELPVEIVRLEPRSSQPLFAKAALGELSPFGETLFLDADTVVLGRLDYGFAKAARHGLACCLSPFAWARRHAGVEGDAVEYNTGVLFFTEKAGPLFARWHELAASCGEGAAPAAKKTENDQGPFARATEETGFCPFVLPPNWNFRPQWQDAFFGPIKIWHDYADPPQRLLEINRLYDRPDAEIRQHSLSDAFASLEAKA